MKWVSKYMPVYDKPVEVLDKCLMKDIREKISVFNPQNPVVSVIVIARNEEKRLTACLWSLADNVSRYPFEIIGVDNASDDSTADIFMSCGVRYFREPRMGHGFARNCGHDQARGKYCICIDSDTLYPPSYIETIVSHLEKPGVIATTGIYDFISDDPRDRIFLFFYKFIRMCHYRIMMIQRPELVARGLVLAYHTEPGRSIGFATHLKRGEDGSMVLELKKQGDIRLVLQSKACAMTSLRSLTKDGDLFSALFTRAEKHLKKVTLYFSRQEKYD